MYGLSERETMYCSISRMSYHKGLVLNMLLHLHMALLWGGNQRFENMIVGTVRSMKNPKSMMGLFL